MKDKEIDDSNCEGALSTQSISKKEDFFRSLLFISH